MTALLFALAIAVTAVGPLTLHLALPAFPAIQRDLATSMGTLQLAVSLAMFAMAVATLAYGPLSDRYGRRPVLIGGLTLFTVGSAICAVAPDITVLIIGRFIQAAGAGCGTVLGRTILADSYSRERLAGMLGYMVAAYTLAPAIAAPLGGALVEFSGWRAVFAFATVGGAVIVAAIVFFLVESNRHPVIGRSVTQLARGNISVLRLPNFLAYTLNMAFSTAAFFSFIAIAPHIVISLQGRSPAEYGTYFLIIPFCYMLGNLITGRLGGRFRSAHMVLVGSSITTTASIGMAVWASLDPASALALFVGAGLMTFGGGISTPHAQASGIAHAGNLAGTASGMMVFIQWGTGAIAAQVVGMIVSDSALPALAMFVGFQLCSSACALIAARRARRGGP